MKRSMRVKLAVVGAVMAAVFLAGSAWAGETQVLNAINTYGGLSAIGDGYGNITVTGSRTGATVGLELGNISGLTINWEAQLIGDPSVYNSAPNINYDFDLITMTGSNGTFNIRPSAVLKITGDVNVNTDREMRLIHVKYPASNIVVNVNGGILETLMPKGNAIDEWNSYKNTTIAADLPCLNVNINGGTISTSDGIVASGYVTVGSGASAHLTGLVVKRKTGVVYDPAVVSAGALEFYGNCKFTVLLYDDGEDWFAPGLLFKIMPGAELTLDAGNGWVVQNTWKLENHGTLNILGTLINEGKCINDYVINNYSGHTLDNRGTLVNNGIINTKATGKITNTGSIDNTSGTINNTEGGTFQSVQTASEMGGTVNGEVQPLNSNSSSGGGGCNAGLGVAGLLLAGWAALKKRKA
jgi:hypothetical protein